VNIAYLAGHAPHPHFQSRKALDSGAEAAARCSKQTAQCSMKKVAAGRAEKRDQGTWNLQHHCQQIGAAQK
jgi:hypothetical protein